MLIKRKQFQSENMLRRNSSSEMKVKVYEHQNTDADQDDSKQNTRFHFYEGDTRLEQDIDTSPLLVVDPSVAANIIAQKKRLKYSKSCSNHKHPWLLTTTIMALLMIVLALTLALVYTVQYDRLNKVTVKPACDLDGRSCVGHRKRYKKAAVASDSPICSQIGNSFLTEKGGNIVDAGIAVLICLGVQNLQSAGIGGGGFLVYHHRATRKNYLVNSRESAPKAAYKDMFKYDYDAAVDGALSIAVPGEVAGYWDLHSRFGKLPWAELFTPTIDMCEQGFTVGSGLDLAIRQTTDKIFKYEGLKNMLVNPATGKVYHTGDIIRLPALAKSLRRVAAGGAHEYYNGTLADDIVADIAEADGIITKVDLRDYKVRSEEALSITLNDGHTMHVVPPPSSGALMGFIYNVMNGFDWRTDTLTCELSSVLFHHRLVETWKYAYSIRYRMGDAEFEDMTEIMKNITSADFADYIREQIDDSQTFDPPHYGPVGETQDDHGTTHLSIIDQEGNAFSATTSINQYFGSKIVGNRTGILFDDTMDDFSVPNKTNAFNLPPSAENFIEPGKQPMSTMTPTIITDPDGDVVMVAGASGGSKILTATSYVILRSLLLTDDLKSAIDAVRLHHQWIPNRLTHEFEIAKYLYDGLKAKGHVMYEQPRLERGAVVQALLRAYIEAYCDVRKGGCPAGYN